MVSTILINGPLGFAVVIAFSYCIVPTIEDALESPTGYDFIEVFYAAVGKAGTAGMTAVLIVLMWVSISSLIESNLLFLLRLSTTIASDIRLPRDIITPTLGICERPWPTFLRLLRESQYNACLTATSNRTLQHSTVPSRSDSDR